MRILIHTDEYYPTAAACAYRMKVFVNTFIDQGNEVVVVASAVNKGNGGMEPQRERIIYAPAVKMRKKTSLMRMLNNLSFGVTSIFAALKAGKIDVVLTTSPPPLVSVPGWIIAKFKRAKLIYDVRDIWPDVALEMGSFSPNSLFCKVFRRITRFMYRHSDVVTTVSPGKVEKIQNHVASCSGRKAGPQNADKVWLVGNGFDETVLKNEFDPSVVEQYELNQCFTCVYIGNIGLAQGLGSLLDVAAKTKCKDVRFLIFGTGAEREALEERVRAEGLHNVRFCGVIEHNKVFTLLSKAKLSFIPLKNSNMKDSIPTKVYEALGIGCPVLLLAEGDSCKIVEEAGLGKWVSPDRAEDLPAIFDEMIANYEGYCLNREAAMELMRSKYSRQQIALRFEKQIRHLF